MRDKAGSIAYRPLGFTLAVASLALLFGLNFGSIFAYKNQLMYVFLLNSYDIDSVVKVILLGAVVGAMCGGSICKGSGRKSGIISGAVIGIAADCSAELATDFSVLLLSELTMGTGLGIYMVSALLYASEISLPSSRGMGCCMPAVGLCLGLLFTIAMRIALPLSPVISCLFIAVTGGAVCLFVALKLPESPRWLVLCGYSDAALTSLFILRRNQAAAAREMAFISDVASNAERGMRAYLHSSYSRRALFALFVLIALMNLAGFTFVPYMSLELIHRYQMKYLGIFVMRNYDYNYGFIKAAVAVAFFGAVTAMMASDRAGRPRLILVASLIGLVSLGFLCAATISGQDDLNVLVISALMLIYIYAAVLCTVTFICVFVSEILPSGGRDTGLTLILTVHIIFFIAALQDVRVMSPGFNLGLCFTVSFICCGFLCFILAFRIPDPGIGSLERNETRLLEGKIFTRPRSGISN